MGKIRASVVVAGISGIIAGTTLLAPPAFAGVKGNYNFGIGGFPYPDGTMTISRHHTWSDAFGFGGPERPFTDSGTWARHGKSITLTVTASGGGANEVGCVLSGTLNKSGINSASSPGSITCPGGIPLTWYAVKAPA